MGPGEKRQSWELGMWSVEWGVWSILIPNSRLHLSPIPLGKIPYSLGKNPRHAKQG